MLDRAIGFAVAGGASRRMGSDKALLPWGEGTLLDHALSRLGAVCDEVHVLSGPEPRYADRGVPVHVDEVAGMGPLGGLYTGLGLLGEQALGVFLAVDVPLVPPELLSLLVQAAAAHDAVVPVLASGPEPLCASYRASCRDAIARRLAAGEFKMTGFWPDVRVRQVTDSELRTFGDPASLFLNVNTLPEYEEALRPVEP